VSGPGDGVTCFTGGIPEPLSMIGSPPSCVIWVSVAEKLPGAVGAKPTVTVHVAPAGTVRFTHVLPGTNNWRPGSRRPTRRA
jgi:hypothetical protein